MRRTLLIPMTLSLLAGCGGGATPTTEPVAEPTTAPEPSAEPEIVEPIQVKTLSMPVHHLVERIGGNMVAPELIIPIGEDPPDWQPSGDVVAALAEAELIVSNGAGFEGWLATAAVPAALLLSTADGQDLIEITGTTHSHGVGGEEHSHEGTDPHTWADPMIYQAQGRAVAERLSALRPAYAENFAGNMTALEDGLRRADEALQQAAASLEGVALAANHPAWNYLARRYELEIENFDFDPGLVPTQRQLSAFGHWLSHADGTPVLLWEEEPQADVVAVFPAGVRHVALSPLEQPGPDGYDYVAMAMANASILKGLAPTP